VSPLLALLHGPDFGGTTAGSSDSDTSGEILPEKKALHVTLLTNIGEGPLASSKSRSLKHDNFLVTQ